MAPRKSKIGAAEPVRGPGFLRMQARLGPDGMEALRQDTLRRQTDARATISGEAPERERETYTGYPLPKGSKPKRHK